jgi:hypothetical protein
VAVVGDALIAARQVIPDMPQVLPATTATVAVVAAIGSTLAAGTYACVVTQRNAYGETINSGETTGLVVGANQGIQITSQLQPGATTIRAYLTLPGGAAGTEQQFIESTSSPFTISTPPPSTGVPPTLNRAWLPDTDGNFISATAMFNWLNDGLRMIAEETGGLLDYCGVPSVLGQLLYTVPGTWKEITSVWYDGYLLLGGDRGQFFRRNTVTSAILSSASISIADNRNILEVYPQPARTAASTTLSSPMTATATTAVLASAAGFALPFGFVQIDTEIMAYSGISGNTLTGLVRGLGGSAAVAHLAAAPANELNIAFSGKRKIAASYVPGQSASTLPVPSGWEVLLFQYLSGRAKLVEHDSQSFDVFTKAMRESIKEWGRTNRGVVRRRQVGAISGPLVYGPTVAGGLIIR